MRYVPILAILIFFSTVLDASYARSIRVGSFLKEKRAEKELVKLEEFVQSNSRLTQLRDKYHFDVKVLVRGKYYLNVIEPLMKKNVVQEILDILRTEYSYVYPKKIRYLPEYAHYGEKKEVVKQQKEEIIDDSELMEKVDKILQHGKIDENDIPIETNVVHKTRHLQKIVADEDESSIFDIFNFFSSEEKVVKSDNKDESSIFDIFKFLDEDEKTVEKVVPKQEVLKVEKSQDSSEGTLETLKSYTLETILAIAVMLLLVLLRFYMKYKQESKNKISMQDIYS